MYDGLRGSNGFEYGGGCWGGRCGGKRFKGQATWMCSPAIRANDVGGGQTKALEWHLRSDGVNGGVDGERGRERRFIRSRIKRLLGSVKECNVSTPGVLVTFMWRVSR